MKTDMRNMVTAEEAFFSDNNTFASAIANTQSATAAAFVRSKGNVIAAPTATATGWSTTVTNPAVDRYAGHLRRVRRQRDPSGYRAGQPARRLAVLLLRL